MRNATLAAAIAMALPLPAAWAQQAPAPSASLGEIIVTAQRRSENIQDVPLSVAPLEGERLAAMFEGGGDIQVLAARVPSLYVESSNGRLAPRFYIRGLGNSDFDLAASQPVSIIVDEVVLENVILKSFPMFDLERVEVLRGPQGTLFGRNTPAGIVKFDTRKPTQEFERRRRAELRRPRLDVLRGRGRRRHLRCRVLPPVGPVPRARRLDRQRLHRRERRDGRLRRVRLPRPAPRRAVRRFQRAAQHPRPRHRRHGVHLPRQRPRPRQRRLQLQLRPRQRHLRRGRQQPAERRGLRRFAEARFRARRRRER